MTRRLSGVPLAWLTGGAQFDGMDVTVHEGVYVPRWQSIELARRAVDRLPANGTAVDVCTGSGALALALRRGRPDALILATDADPLAVACARTNGVVAHLGDLFAPLPAEVAGTVDVVVAVVPYVPTAALDLLPRDTLAFESVAHYDGGPDGTDLLVRAVAEARAFLRPGGALLLELGGDQADRIRSDMDRHGYRAVTTWADDDGDLRGIEGILD